MRNNLNIDDFTLGLALNSDDAKNKQCILIYYADYVIHLLEKYIDSNKKYYITVTDRILRKKAEKMFLEMKNVEIVETEHSCKSIKKGVSYVLDLSNRKNWSKHGLDDIGYSIGKVSVIHAITHGGLVCNINDSKARQYFLKEAHVDKIVQCTDKEHIIKRTMKTYFVSIKSQELYRKGKVPSETKFMTYTRYGGNFKLLKEQLVDKRVLMGLKNWNPEVILNRNNDEVFNFMKSNIEKLPIRKIKHTLYNGRHFLQPYTKKGNISVITREKISNNKISYGTLKKIKTFSIKDYECYMLKKGDVLVCSNDGHDNIAVFEGEEGTTTIDSHVFCIRFKENINPYYVKLFLQLALGQRYLTEAKRANMVKDMDLKVLENILIPIIPMEEQEILVEYFYSIKKSHENNTDKAKSSILDIDLNIRDTIFKING